VVVADSQKFSNTAMCRVFRPDGYDLIISDCGVDKRKIRRFGKIGINIEVA